MKICQKFRIVAKFFYKTPTHDFFFETFKQSARLGLKIYTGLNETTLEVFSTSFSKH